MSEISPRIQFGTISVSFKDQEGTEFGSISFGASVFDKTGFEGTLNSNSIAFEYQAVNYEATLYIKGVSNTTEMELINFHHISSSSYEDIVEIPDEYLDESTLQFRIVCETYGVDETWSVAYSKTSDRVTRTGSASFEITSITENATIYYTIDGTEPTTESSIYSDSISTTENITVKALATREGLLNSNITSTDIKVKLPDPEITQKINGDKGTLSITNSYDSYEGVTFKISKDYGDYSEESFPYEVTSNGTYITQAISAGKNVNSNKVPVEVTELKAGDPSIDVDDPEGSFRVTVTVGGVSDIPETSNHKTAVCTGLSEWLDNNTEICTIEGEDTGGVEYKKGAVVTLKRPNNTEGSYYLDDINLVTEEKATTYCYKDTTNNTWGIVLGGFYSILIYPAGFVAGDVSLENETIVFTDELNMEGSVSLTFNKDIDSVAYMKDSLEMTLTTGGANIAEGYEDFIGWSGYHMTDWLFYNATLHHRENNVATPYLFDNISVSIKDSGTFNKTFNQLIIDPEADISEGKLRIVITMKGDSGSLEYKDSGKSNMFYILLKNYVTESSENPLGKDVIYLGSSDSGLVSPITITFTKNEEATSDDEFVVNMTKNPDLPHDDMNMIPTAVATGLPDWITEKATTIDTADIQGGGRSFSYKYSSYN